MRTYFCILSDPNWNYILVILFVFVCLVFFLQFGLKFRGEKLFFRKSLNFFAKENFAEAKFPFKKMFEK